MSVSYYPIETDQSVTDTASGQASTPCSEVTTVLATASATVSISKSLPQQYTPLSESRGRLASTSGNWSDIKESGEIKMTPMQAWNNKTENYLGTFFLDKHALDWGFSANTHDSNCNRCVRNDAVYPVAHASIGYTEKGDLTYWRSKFPTVPYFELTSGFDSGRLESLKSSAYQELFQEFNLGEEIYELRDTLRFLSDLVNRGLSGMKGFFDSIENLWSKDGYKAASQYWLEYRYGIMPIIYSIQDLDKLLSSRGNYRTVRKSLNPEVSSQYIGYSGTHFWETGIDSSVIRITAKGRWGSSVERIIDLINVNPFTTAAAVYPWSLVVRWFFNINSAIDAYVKSFTTSALEYNAVIAKKTSKETSTYFKLHHDSRKSIYYNGDSGSCGLGWYPVLDVEVGTVSTNQKLLRKEVIDSYERTLFHPTEVRVAWNPNITLSRAIDSISFLTNRNSRLLRGNK